MSTSEHSETELERKLRAEIEEDESAEPVGIPEDGDEESTTEALSPMETLQAELDDAKDNLLRSRAEFDNYRKRTSREVERIRKTAAESVIHDLLPVLDNLELALEHADSESSALTEGVGMVRAQMLDVLARNGLDPIPAVGKPFDPNVHEAVSQETSNDVPKDNVSREYQRGYKLGGQVIRPSKVVVSLGPENETAEQSN